MNIDTLLNNIIDDTLNTPSTKNSLQRFKQSIIDTVTLEQLTAGSWVDKNIAKRRDKLVDAALGVVSDSFGRITYSNSDLLRELTRAVNTSVARLLPGIVEEAVEKYITTGGDRIRRSIEQAIEEQVRASIRTLLTENTGKIQSQIVEKVDSIIKAMNTTPGASNENTLS